MEQPGVRIGGAVGERPRRVQRRRLRHRRPIDAADVSEVADNLDFTIGRKHATRVGFEVFGGRYRYFDARNAAGTYTFSSLEAYQAGTPLQFTQRIGEVNTSFTAYQTALYWQDDIRTTRTLTISLGVRQEMQSLIANKINLMPRLGLTYSPRNSKTIVRGGSGCFTTGTTRTCTNQTLRVKRHRAARRSRQLPRVSRIRSRRQPIRRAARRSASVCRSCSRAAASRRARV